MRTTPFIRYLQGSPAYPEDDLQEVITSTVTEVEDQQKLASYLRSKVMRSSGFVALESTWHQLILELLETLSRSGRSPSHLLKVLAMLREEPVDFNASWQAVRSHLLEHLHEIAGWEEYRRRLPQLGGKVIRKDNRYFLERRGKVVAEVHGMTTDVEEEFQFLSRDALRQYGRTWALLKLIALWFTASHFKVDPAQYPDSMVCVLHEAEYGTSFLHWRWSRRDPYATRDVGWSPPEKYCDPQWLGHDLLAHFASARKLPEEIKSGPLRTQVSVEAWEQNTRGFVYQYEVALDTDVVLGDGDEFYLHAGDRKARWINGNDYLTPLLIMPVKNSDDYECEMTLVRRLLSQLSYALELPIRQITSCMSVKRFLPLLGQSRKMASIVFPDPRFQFREGLTRRQEIALALYREARNSHSASYALLNYFKIVTMVSGEGKAFDTWVDRRLDPQRVYGLADWQKLVSNADPRTCPPGCGV